jgi:hypothetical protein
VEERRHPRLINSNVDRGLIISGLSAVYGALGLLGYFCKIAEGHLGAALLGILMGLGIAGHYLGDRAERTGDVSTRQFTAASILARIVGFVLIAAGALLAASIVAAALITIVGPWLPPSRYAVWREPSIVTLAGIYLGIAGFHYLGDRAERAGDVSARKFTAASILARIVGFALPKRVSPRLDKVRPRRS